MFISIFTTLALILQIGAFAVHVHPLEQEHVVLSIDNRQIERGHHCDLCDGILQIASQTTVDITFVNSCSLLPHIESSFLSSPSPFSERASSRAPPVVYFDILNYKKHKGAIS